MHMQNFRDILLSDDKGQCLCKLLQGVKDTYKTYILGVSSLSFLISLMVKNHCFFLTWGDEAGDGEDISRRQMRVKCEIPGNASSSSPTVQKNSKVQFRF